MKVKANVIRQEEIDIEPVFVIEPTEFSIDVRAFGGPKEITIRGFTMQSKPFDFRPGRKYAIVEVA